MGSFEMGSFGSLLVFLFCGLLIGILIQTMVDTYNLRKETENKLNTISHYLYMLVMDTSTKNYDSKEDLSDMVVRANVDSIVVNKEEGYVSAYTKDGDEISRFSLADLQEFINRGREK